MATTPWQGLDSDLAQQIFTHPHRGMRVVIRRGMAGLFLLPDVQDGAGLRGWRFLFLQSSGARSKPLGQLWAMARATDRRAAHINPHEASRGRPGLNAGSSSSTHPNAYEELIVGCLHHTSVHEPRGDSSKPFPPLQHVPPFFLIN